MNHKKLIYELNPFPPPPPPPKRKILPTPLKKFLRMSCAVDWKQFRASVQYQNFIVSCFPYHFRVRQITFSARIRLNHLGVVQILRKARITHRIKILSRLSKILSAIPLVLIHLVSLFITYSVSFSLSYLNDILMYVLLENFDHLLSSNYPPVFLCILKYLLDKINFVLQLFISVKVTYLFFVYFILGSWWNSTFPD